MVATNISAKRASDSPACRVFCAPINVSETTSWSNSLNIHQCFTFPYMSATGTLKMTVSGLDADVTVIRKRVFNDVPVTRNRITYYTGKFFEDGDGVFTQSDFSFLIHADWDGGDHYDF